MIKEGDTRMYNTHHTGIHVNMCQNMYNIPFLGWGFVTRLKQICNEDMIRLTFSSALLGPCLESRPSACPRVNWFIHSEDMSQVSWLGFEAFLGLDSRHWTLPSNFLASSLKSSQKLLCKEWTTELSQQAFQMQYPIKQHRRYVKPPVANFYPRSPGD